MSEKDKLASTPYYTDTEGNTLGIATGKQLDDGSTSYDALVLAWWVPENAAWGYAFSPAFTGTGFAEDTSLVTKACTEFFEEKGLELPAPHVPFIFPDEQTATECLLRVNRKLLEWKKSKPWPDWAVLAREAGWKPPEGWEP